MALTGVFFLKEKLRVRLVVVLLISYVGLTLVMMQEEIILGRLCWPECDTCFVSIIGIFGLSIHE